MKPHDFLERCEMQDKKMIVSAYFLFGSASAFPWDNQGK